MQSEVKIFTHVGLKAFMALHDRHVGNNQLLVIEESISGGNELENKWGFSVVLSHRCRCVCLRVRVWFQSRAGLSRRSAPFPALLLCGLSPAQRRGDADVKGGAMDAHSA